ncbi:Peptidase S1 PA clan [Arabidopsis thaliana x Arabidopsis arenosa]|uniref:Peptidase S1 PA clan n=1 Tax=Arabidopsis thaliana x Arabidopsis arenosa TaxID=1240361 RepID=A0A8T1Z2E4_9BRAS|nr:Peptidase S1 PA clan [Arabidopsis thaliana x Arabidopsis arenosa]
MPNLLQPMRIVGYPRGGDMISITSDIILRINILTRTRSSALAINSRNSGGPVFIGNEVIGVAFKRLVGGDNIRYVIPARTVELFLASVDKGDETWFCSLGISLQSMENPTMQKYFNLWKIMTGVLVTEFNVLSQSNESLEKNNVILENDGIP